MPNSTFLNLPEAKRARVFEAAVEEFAEHRFSEASVNRVIKAAGISRGSFYQYFQNKEDLYTYVLQEIGKEKIGIISGRELAGMSFYELIHAALPQIFSWAGQNPSYSRIGLLMLEDDPAFLRRVMLNMADSLAFLEELFRREQRQGLIRPGIRMKTVIQLLISAAASTIRSYYEAGDAQEAQKRVMEVMDIICNGFSAGRKGSRVIYQLYKKDGHIYYRKIAWRG